MSDEKNVRVYTDHKGFHTMYIAPGAHCKDVAEWLSSEGIPLEIPVKIMNGVAEVSAPIAKYMVDKGFARATRIATVNYNFARTSQKKSEESNSTSEVFINCPDCGEHQPEPSEATHYICANFTCRRDFIKDPLQQQNHVMQPESNPLATLLAN